MKNLTYGISNLGGYLDALCVSAGGMPGWFDLAFLVVKPRMGCMDRAITASEANQRFSEMLREVAEGDSFTVLSRGRPVARVTPVDREDEKRRIENLLEYVRKLPLRCVGPWDRESLYD